jgi:hypothetical protein
MKRSKKCGFGFLETEPKFFTCYQPDIRSFEWFFELIKYLYGMGLHLIEINPTLPW